MLLRDRLQERLAEMGEMPDYVRLTSEVLGIRNAPEALAQRLVAQALVMEDRREEWARVGARVCAAVPDIPGVYLMCDARGAALYVGKAVNLRRRLRAHFAERRWHSIRPDMARVADVKYQAVGSELEALLLEAQWIREFAPTVNVQVHVASVEAAGSRRLTRDVLVILPSIDVDSVELVAARASGAVLVQRTRRDGEELAAHIARLWIFAHRPPASGSRHSSRALLSPIVFSWLAGRGAGATRIEIADVMSRGDLHYRVAAALQAEELFSERLVLRNARSGRWNQFLTVRPGTSPI